MGWWKEHKTYEGCHVFITGGSTGIGFSLATQFAKLGANISLVSRTQSKLDTAKKELQTIITEEDLPGKVLTVSTDVSKNHEVKQALRKAENEIGPVNIAICCAGAAHPGRFVDQDIELFENSMQLDYFGSLYVAKAVLPSMLKQKSGQILFIASPLAVTGISGYSTYCPAKNAIRGLADVLRNEYVGTGISFSVGYPLDTDTPGFANENLTKPPETEAISRLFAGPVYSSKKIAEGLIQGLKKEQYHIKTPEFAMNILISSMANITPRPYFILLEFLWAPVLVLILYVAGKLVDSTVRKERKKVDHVEH